AGGGLQAAERQAQANWTRAQEALHAAQRELELRVHREYRNVIESAERMRALEQAQASAAIALESSRRSHEAGVRTLLDVLNADQQLQVARRNLAQARYEHLLARVRLRVLVNDDIEQEIAAINAALIAEPVPRDQARQP
ncbi:MAG: TolC family protein, partial [Thermomonas haemolytica]